MKQSVNGLPPVSHCRDEKECHSYGKNPTAAFHFQAGFKMLQFSTNAWAKSRSWELLLDLHLTHLDCEGLTVLLHQASTCKWQITFYVTNPHVFCHYCSLFLLCCFFLTSTAHGSPEEHSKPINMPYLMKPGLLAR